MWNKVQKVILIVITFVFFKTVLATSLDMYNTIMPLENFFSPFYITLSFFEFSEPPFWEFIRKFQAPIWKGVPIMITQHTRLIT